jgi:phage/plasmid-like protein (TIGR03299 family)
MSHELEFVDGQAAMVYTGEVPWHGLGTKVDGNLTPAQMLKAAKLNWTVEKVPAYARIADEEEVYIGHDALVRSRDHKILDVVTHDWNPVQNQEAFEFFNEFCQEGKMTMETAGSLKGGQLVWGLAKIGEAFDLFNGKDKIDGYMLFTNPHIYGWSTSVSLNAIRVVCMNTLRLALTAKGKTDKIVKVSHRREFIAEEVKEALGISREKLARYKEMAEFLASKKAPKTDIVKYFQTLFPVLTQKKDSKKELSKAASICLGVLDTQPGAEIGAGTWWQGYNTVTYYTDHLAGRTKDNRLHSAWYGLNRGLKIKALETAVEMANVS